MQETETVANPQPHSLRPFFVLWGGQAISLFGSQIVQFALIWWLTEETGSATILAVASLVGDTLPCDGVDDLAAEADVYVQSVLRRDFVERLPGPMAQDILDYHSSVVDAAQTAARVGVKRLAMTHMVPAPTPEQYPEWIARAAEHFDGEIIIGDDLTTITV